MSSEDTIKQRLRSSSKSDNKDISLPNMATPGSSALSSVQQKDKEEKAQKLNEITLDEGGEVTQDRIWQVLQVLVSSVNEIKKGIGITQGMKQDFSNIKTSQVSIGTRLNQLESSVESISTRLDLIGNMIIKQEEASEVLEDTVKGIKRSKTRPNLVVRGLVETLSENVEKTAEIVKEFFKNEMEISESIEIKKAYRLGKKEKGDRPMMIKLANANDKAVIFKSAPKLKGKKNVKRKLFNIDDDMDAEQAETKNYYRDLIRENFQKEDDEKLQLNSLGVR